MIKNYKANIAIIHDWFTSEFTGGAEKVFKEIEEIIIESKSHYEIFSLVNHLDKNQNLKTKKFTNTSFIQPPLRYTNTAEKSTNISQIS